MILQGFSYREASKIDTVTHSPHLSTLFADSVRERTYSLGEVVVSATRTPISQSLAPSHVSVIPKLFLEEHSGQSTGDLLIGQPGLFIRSNGAGLALQVASFRGMGAEHTQVLFDGVPVANTQTGVTDLRMISLEGIERLELVRGGSSAIYGSDAIGGVINLISSAAAKSTDASIGTSIGSFGSESYWMNAHIPVGERAALQLCSSTRYGREDYPFTIWDGRSWVWTSRLNSDYRLVQAHAKGEWRPSEDTRLSLSLDRMSSNQGTPGAILTIANQGEARQADDGLRVGFLLDAGEASLLPWKLAGILQNSYEHYTDLSANIPADNYYRNVMATFASSVRYIAHEGLAFNGGAEVSRAVANSNALPDDKSRSSVSVFGGSEIRWRISSTQVSLYPLLRYDEISDVGYSFSPKVGLNLRREMGVVGPLDQLSITLHSTAGRDFRAPTFNQLYYTGGGGQGNPNLVPEHSTSFDAGLTLDGDFAGRHQFDATYYLIATRDRLLWLPTASTTIWSPVNVGKTQSSGVELEWRWLSFKEMLTLEANYAMINSLKKFRSSPNDPTYDKQLIYVPLETASISLTARIPVHESVLTGISFWCNDAYTGPRFAVEDNSLAPPGYHFVRAHAIVEVGLLGVGVKLKYEIDNILNQEFEIISRYPMPLRSQSVSVSIHKRY